MRKKIIILIIIVFVLLLITGGLFYWWEKEKTWDVYRYSKPSNYIIKEDTTGRILENTAAGLVIKIPDEWDAKIGDIGGEGIVNLYCPNTEFYQNGAIKEGCIMQVQVLDCSRKDSMTRVDLEQTQHIINILLSGLNFGGIQQYKVREISGFKALEEAASKKSDEREATYISIRVPLEKKLYHFDVLLVPYTSEKYSRFEEILNTVLIK